MQNLRRKRKKRKKEKRLFFYYNNKQKFWWLGGWGWGQESLLRSFVFVFRERGRERGRQTDRQTDRDRQTAARERERERGWTDERMDRQTDRQAEIRTEHSVHSGLRRYWITEHSTEPESNPEPTLFEKAPDDELTHTETASTTSPTCNHKPEVLEFR